MRSCGLPPHVWPHEIWWGHTLRGGRSTSRICATEHSRDSQRCPLINEWDTRWGESESIGNGWFIILKTSAARCISLIQACVLLKYKWEATREKWRVITYTKRVSVKVLLLKRGFSPLLSIPVSHTDDWSAWRKLTANVGRLSVRVADAGELMRRDTATGIRRDGIKLIYTADSRQGLLPQQETHFRVWGITANEVSALFFLVSFFLVIFLPWYQTNKCYFQSH